MAASLSLSIVIPSHRRTDLLAACLRSVCEHGPEGVEVIVVDDGSVKGAVQATAECFPSVKVCHLKKRKGFCIAANSGLQQAAGEVVQLLNDDTLVTPGWFDYPLKRFADPQVGAVAPLLLLGEPGENETRIDSAGDDYDLGGFACKRGHRQLLCVEFTHPCEVFGASGAAAFYRRAALRRTGAFPLDFGAYFEDVDLSFRLRRAGYRIWYEPGSVVWHRCGASYGKRSRKLLEQQSLNEERVFWRNLTPAQLRQNLPRHAAVLAGKALRRLREGTLIPFLTGRLQLLRSVRETILYRRMQFGEGRNRWDGNRESGIANSQVGNRESGRAKSTSL